MNNVLKTILILSVAILSTAIWIEPARAEIEGLSIFPDPVFEDVTNFLPGDSTTSVVTITNNSEKDYDIISLTAEADLDKRELASALELEIGEASMNLDDLLDGGILGLSGGIENGDTRTFDFTMKFKERGSEIDNDFKGESVNFDLIFIFEEGEGGTVTMTVSGGGGGLPAGLTIFAEAEEDIATTSVTITWTTSYFSTSQVIYGAEGESHTLDLTDNTGTPPKYGYARTTPEYDTSPKVTAHSVIITGLTPGTIYYYRCVSHASLAVSTEHSFTTLEGPVASGEEEEEEEEEEEGPVGPGEEEEEEGVMEGETEEGVTEEGITEEGIPVEGEEGIEEVGEEIEEEEKVIAEAEEEEGLDLTGFLAAIGNVFGLENLWWIFILAVVILIILFLLSRRKKKKEV